MIRGDVLLEMTKIILGPRTEVFQPFLNLVQHEIDRLDRAISLFCEHDSKMVAILSRIVDRVQAKPPNGQTNCEHCGSKKASSDGNQKPKPRSVGTTRHSPASIR